MSILVIWGVIVQPPSKHKHLKLEFFSRFSSLCNFFYTFMYSAGSCALFSWLFHVYYLRSHIFSHQDKILVGKLGMLGIFKSDEISCNFLRIFFDIIGERNIFHSVSYFHLCQIKYRCLFTSTNYLVTVSTAIIILYLKVRLITMK